MKNLIVALSSSLDDKGYVMVTEAYLNAVRGSGGIPSVLAPNLDDEYIREVCETSDGFLFCGGDDLDPKYYGEKIDGSQNICSRRDEFEEKLFAAAYKTGKPILGICRGMQVINVFMGGSLYQHIDGHRQSEARDVRTHGVTLSRGGMLADIIGECEIRVNSFHHQLVKRLAEGLSVDGVSEVEGYIEAFHDPNHPFLLGVQWHPEGYFKHCETSSKIFKAFIEACGER